MTSNLQLSQGIVTRNHSVRQHDRVLSSIENFVVPLLIFLKYCTLHYITELRRDLLLLQTVTANEILNF